MTIDNVQLLTRFFSDATGQSAFDKLSASLATKTVSQLVSEENDFLLQAARVFGERLPSDAGIDGSEENAHRVLRHLLVEYGSGGVSALKNLKNIYCP